MLNLRAPIAFVLTLAMGTEWADGDLHWQRGGHVGDTQEATRMLVDKFVGNLYHRVLTPSLLHPAKMDDTTSGKHDHLATLPRSSMRELAVSAVSSARRLQTFQSLPRLTNTLSNRFGASSRPPFGAQPKRGRYVEPPRAFFFTVVGQGDVEILERWGKFNKELKPGIHFYIPFADRVRATITQREQVFDIRPQKCITSDNAPITADAVVYYSIIYPQLAVYSVMNLEVAIQNLVLTQLRSEIGKLTLQETFSARERINAILLKDLDLATDPWGVKITRVEVRDIIPNPEIMKAMEMEVAAERTKRALIIKSEGERMRAINEAEGLAQSRLIEANATAEAVRLQANAEAEALETKAGALGGQEQAARFQLLSAHIEAQRDLATSSNSKVILSSGTTDDVFAKAIAFYDATRDSKSVD